VGDSPVVLGLDFGGTKIAMAVCEVSGDRLGSATVRSGGELGAQASFERGIGAARDLLAAEAPGRELAAVGVSTFGIPFDDRVELAPAISGQPAGPRRATGRLPVRAAVPEGHGHLRDDSARPVPGGWRGGPLPAACQREGRE
jgi:hypothetical protein